eukprot:32984_1
MLIMNDIESLNNTTNYSHTRKRVRGFCAKEPTCKKQCIRNKNQSVTMQQSIASTTTTPQQLPIQSQNKRQSRRNNVEFKATDNTQLQTQPILITTQSTATNSTRILKSTDKHYTLTLNREKGSCSKDKRTVQIDITWTESTEKALFDIKHKAANAKRSGKVTPNWVKNQPVKFVAELVIGMFGEDRKRFFDDTNKIKLKKELVVKIAFSKFCWVIDAKSNAKLSWCVSELNEIEEELNKIKDIDYDLYHFLIAQERYLSNEQFVKTLDFLIEDCNFIECVQKLWNLFKRFLHEGPEANKLEHRYQNLYLESDEYQEIKELQIVYDERFNLSQHFGLSFEIFKGILIRNMKILFIAKLKLITYDILHLEQIVVKIGKLDDYQEYCYGGASVCTIIHVWYGMKMDKNKKKIHVQLTKSLCVTPDSQEYINHVPLKLQYQNKGYMYVMAPKVHPFTKKLLNHCWDHIHTQYEVFKKIPKFDAIVKEYQSSQTLWSMFQALFNDEQNNEHSDIIRNIYERYVKHSCSKLFWTSIDQMGLCEDGMALRDKFKYEHIKQREKAKANQY